MDGILTWISTGSLAYLPRKRAARHRGKVKRLVFGPRRRDAKIGV